jgi:TonB family protein
VFYRLNYEFTTTDGAKIVQPPGYMAYVAGEYRFLGERIEQTILGVPAMRIRQGRAVTAASLINRVQPEYPAEAKAQHISGNVRLHAIIGTNGAVASLEVLSGDLLLAQAATEAVRRWRYCPTTRTEIPLKSILRSTWFSANKGD